MRDKFSKVSLFRVDPHHCVWVFLIILWFLLIVWVKICIKISCMSSYIRNFKAYIFDIFWIWSFHKNVTDFESLKILTRLLHCPFPSKKWNGLGMSASGLALIFAEPHMDPSYSFIVILRSLGKNTLWAITFFFVLIRQLNSASSKAIYIPKLRISKELMHQIW